MARCIWALVDPEIAEFLVDATEPNAKCWLFHVMDMVTHDAFVKIVVTLWAIWAARRKSIHEGIFQSPQATYQYIERFISDLGDLKQPAPVRRATSQRHVPIGQKRPRAPSLGFAKIHVDAGVSEMHNRRGSSAAVVRDSQGNFLGSSSLVVRGQLDPATLEAIACLEGTALALELGLDRFIIACDSKQVVADIHTASKGEYSAIIEEIKRRIPNTHCKIIFEGRASNNEAHSLARFSLSLDHGRHFWLLQPHDILCIPYSLVFDE